MAIDATLLKQERVHKLILKFASFSIITMLATGAVTMAGTFIVSRGIDIHAVGAMGVLFPLVTLYFGFSQLIAIGAASYISRMLGKCEDSRAKSAIITAYSISLVISLTLVALTLIFKSQILNFLGADGEYKDNARLYISLFVYSVPFTSMTLLASAIFRAYGNLKFSMLLIVLEASIIIGLDALFTFVFNFGMAGVGISNAIAGFIAASMGIILLLKRIGGVKFVKSSLKIDLEIFKGILSIGVSALSRSLVIALFAFVLNRTVDHFAGEEVLTALGTVNRITILLFMVIMGINQAMQPIVSFNYTAKEYSRVKEALKYALIYSSIIGMLGMLIGFLIPRQIITIFTQNSDILDDATQILRMQLLVYVTMGVQTLSATYFQAIGKAKMSFFLSVFKHLLFLIPLAFILPRIFSENAFAIWWTYPIADSLTAIIASIILAVNIKNLRPNE